MGLLRVKSLREGQLLKKIQLKAQRWILRKYVICENTSNPDTGYCSNFSLKEVNSKYLRLDVDDTNKPQSVQGLLDNLFNSHGWRIPDCSCEKFDFCTHLVQFQGLIFQLVIFEYDE